MVQKAPGAYQTISEVSVQLDVPAHVLRFWESKFTDLKPLKRSGGRRYYRTEDIQLLKSKNLMIFLRLKQWGLEVRPYLQFHQFVK